jgi:CshA-type fibril repeat protein
VKYVVADSNGQVTGANITPTVTAPAAPVATAESKSVIPGGTVAFTTLTGTGALATSGVGLDTSLTCLITPGSTPDACDTDGVVTVAGVGTYTLNASTGVVTLVADAAATAGTKTALKYQVTDITGQKVTSTLTPVVPPLPVAVNDTSSGAYDTNQTITILANDTATTPATIVASSVKLCATTATANASCTLTTLEVAGQGTYTVNANGTVTFDPLPTFKGAATPVKYVVADSNTQLAGATITPTVALPTPPVATADSKSVIPGGTVAFTTITGTGGLATSGVGLDATVTCLLTPSTTTCDADGIVTVAGVGTYTLNKTTGVVTLVADPAATAGTKTALKYRVTDTFGQTATSTLTPVVPPLPVATNDTSSGAYDTNQVISPFTNDTATSPATIVASSVKLCATTATVNASCTLTTLEVAGQGTYTVNANGTVTFDPLSTFSGVATAVKYVIADTNTQVASATITPTVALPPVPTANPEAKAVIPGGTVAFTTLTGTSGIATSPTGFNTASTCLITPASSPATCDADGIVTVTGVGTYTLNKTTGVVTLVADAGATQGTKAALTYQVTDIYGQKATSTLTPTIPAPPVGNNDTSSGAFDTNQVISPLTNDTATTPAILEPSTVKLCATTSTANASCTLTTLTVANQGTYTVNSNGTVTFDPLPNFTGVASPVKYVAADSSGQVISATITPTVALPIPPVATAESKAVIPGGTVAFTTLTGTNGLATAQAGFTNASTCLITPASSPAACDADGVVTVAGVGTYTLNTTTGVVTLVADPAATQGTKAALTYQVTDTYGQKTTSTLTPTIPAPPVGVNDTPSGAYDTNQVISPLANDTTTAPATFIPSTLKLCATTSTANSSCNLDSLVVPNEGTYTVNPDGTVTFDPLPTFKGTATPVKYVVTETSNQQTSATITPTVAAPNGPTATAQTKTVNPGDTVAYTTLTGANGLASAAAGLNTGATCLYTPNTTTCDLDGVVTISGEGTYTLNTSTGVVTFAADPAATAGTKTVIRYEVQDITGQKATSTLTPIIPPAPVANNDIKTGAYDTTQVIPILTNDTPGSGATLVPSSVKLCPTSLILSVTSSCTLTTLTVPDEGTYTVNPDGTVTFDPLSTFKGTATPVNYVVADTTGQVDNASITPTVTAPTAPVVTPETKSVIPGGTVAFTTLTGTNGLATSGVGLNTSVTCLIAPATSTCDADGVVTISGEGTYTLNPTTGVVSFVADAAATPGSKTPITYQVQDITGQKVTSTLTPTIPAAPGAVNDTSSGTFDANQVISPLANDTVTSPATFDRSSLKLCATTSTANSSCTLTSLTVPDEGTYTVYPNGTVVFDPLPTFTGPATPVKYVVVDSTGQVTSATITPTVSSPSIPVATPETKSVIPGGTVAFTTITGTNGLASSGVGLDATVTCLITPGTTTCDLDGVVTVSGVGTYTLNTTTGVVTLVADANATPGTKASLTYQVTDTFGQTKTSTLTPVIPAPPVGANDTSSGAYDTNQVISPLTNDTVTSPATLVPSSLKLCATTSTADVNCNFTSLTVPNEGTYTVNPNGTVTFDPLETFKGTATPVKYVVADSTGQLTHATITSTVIAPAVPVATSETKSVIPGATATFTTITSQGGLATSAAGFIPTATCLITPSSSPTTCDADGVVVIPGEGTYTLNTSTGAVTFVADLAATPGSKTSITYQVQDITGQKATATLTPVIPSPPVGVNDIKTGAYDTNQVISPLANDSATSPATLVPSSLKLCTDTTNVIALCTLTSLTVPNEGTYTVNQDGTVTFDPLPTFAGVATPVKYVVADSTGQFTSATITSTVTPPRVPIAVNDVSTGPYDANQLINLLLGDTPGEPGLPLLPSSIRICPLNATSPFTSTNCSLVPTQASPLVTADGSYWIDPTTGILTFDPLPTFAGTVTQPLRYVVKDAMNQTVSATITPSVTAPPIPTATPQTQLLLPGETVSFTNITGTSALASGTLLQTSGATATCLYVLNTTTCDADNTVTVAGEGTFVLDPSTGVVTYTADVNATVGTKTSITYRVTDILGRTATSTLTPVIPAATVVALDVTRNGWDSIQTISPLANDTPSNGVVLIASTLKLCADGESALAGTCTLTTLIVPGEGTYTVNPDGKVTFDPLPTFTGTATPVDYQVTDSLSRKSGSTITPEVAVPGPPVATPERKVLVPGATVVFTNVIGTNALALGAALQTGPTNGPCLIDPITNLCGTTVMIANEGTWTIDQTTGAVTFASLSTIAVGPHTPVTYRVTDVLGTTVTSTLTPIIPEVPTVSNDEKVSGWDTNQTFSPFANDKFDSNAPVVVSSLKLCGPGESLGSCTRKILSIENEGTYTVNSDGTVTFDPLPTFHGTATPVTYQAIDIAGQLLHATITPTVTAPPIPVATTDEVSGKKGRSVVFSPWLNDLPGTAPDDFTGTIKLVPSSIRLCGLGQVAPDCTLTKLTTADGKYTVDTKTGKVTFVPRSGFSGLVTQPVTYQISNDWKGPSGVGISSALLIANIGAGTLPTTGFDFGVVFVMGGLTMGAGAGLWRISTGRKRGKYHHPRWLNEVDGE